jgi:hypothetical protein
LGTYNLNAINVVFHIGWKIVGLNVVTIQGWVILKICVRRKEKKLNHIQLQKKLSRSACG